MGSLSVPGSLDSLGPLRDCVRTAASSAGLDRTAVYRLVLAVDEVATNIVTHGYDEAGLVGAIVIWCEVDPDVFRVCIEDTGAPYDPSRYHAVDVDQPLENRKEGGLGVFLAMHGVDDLQYGNAGGRNLHKLIVQRHPNNRTGGAQ